MKMKKIAVVLLVAVFTALCALSAGYASEKADKKEKKQTKRRSAKSKIKSGLLRNPIVVVDRHHGRYIRAFYPDLYW